mmetsp:Transcript_31815/g.46374  ORF Transcript_31815/g.46374 Transcript_31815/m.46374 type:complete len:206 (+) Transcript_31815:62-679(+)
MSNASQPPPSGPVISHVFRLNPGDSLKSSLRHITDVIFKHHSHSSAFVLTAVGSLEDVTLRLANAPKKDTQNEQNNSSQGENCIRRWENQRFEIVSLVGTISDKANGHHLHMSLSDGEGNTIGGHFMDGVVFTTVEIVLGTVGEVKLTREHDENTGYRELVARQIQQAGVDEEEGIFSTMVKHRVVMLMVLLTGVVIGSNLPKRR